MAKIYYYPSCPPGGYGNPYSSNVKNALAQYGEVLDNNNIPIQPAVKGLLKNCCKADLFILNWIEGIANHRLGLLQYCLAFVCFLIIKIRKKKIIWTLHNIHPHGGANKYSERISNYLYHHADIITTHSKGAQKYAEGKAYCPVYYVCHPFNTFDKQKFITNTKIDVLIWGGIYPYKGIPQFLKEANKRGCDLIIKVLGTCSNKDLSTEIENQIKGHANISFENRRPEYEELAKYIASSKYVLFPYIGDSVSSSGALMDTIAMGGVAIGPNVGAFKDLNEEGLCVTYNNYDELFEKIEKEIEVSTEDISCFVEANSWDNYARFLFQHIHL